MECKTNEEVELIAASPVEVDIGDYSFAVKLTGAHIKVVAKHRLVAEEIRKRICTEFATSLQEAEKVIRTRRAEIPS